MRFKSLLSNETKQYFKYGLGEVVLVVIGILLALQVNNWNEKRKLVNEEKKHYYRSTMKSQII